MGESKIISFDGTYLRTADIMGQVSVEGDGVEGVTVSLGGGADATDMTTMTDAAGQYSVAKLRAGDYARVGISGNDTDGLRVRGDLAERHRGARRDRERTLYRRAAAHLGRQRPYDRIGVAVDSGCVSQLMVRATRKPASNRPGVHLLKRAAERRLIGKLRQEPPRSTR